jgi:hypothetical protein
LGGLVNIDAIHEDADLVSDTLLEAGPLSAEDVARASGLTPSRAAVAIGYLLGARRVVVGPGQLWQLVSASKARRCRELAQRALDGDKGAGEEYLRILAGELDGDG